jgi:oxygen-independent coproporphyrinogen-3 oxidase
VTTLSLGVQSPDPASLAFLGRTHGVDAARRAVELARGAGFDTVSLDLIYGLPGQTAEDWRAQLDAALAMRPQHMSCYQLTIHERTRFHLLERRGRLTQLPVDAQADLFRLTHRHLADAAMQGYEVSQFSSSVEHRSRHNMKYWNHTPYLGLGPSAHSFHDRRRWWNLRRTDPWEAAVREGARPIDDEEALDVEALTLEALMTGLRTYAGVDLAGIQSRWGVELVEPNRTLVSRLGDDGLAVADSIASRFRLGPGRATD